MSWCSVDLRVFSWLVIINFSISEMLVTPRDFWIGSGRQEINSHCEKTTPKFQFRCLYYWANRPFIKGDIKMNKVDLWFLYTELSHIGLHRCEVLISFCLIYLMFFFVISKTISVGIINGEILVFTLTNRLECLYNCVRFQLDIIGTSRVLLWTKIIIKHLGIITGVT